MENLRAVRGEVTEELNDQFIEKLSDKGEYIGKTMRQHLDAVMEYMDRKFDSRAPVAGMEQIDETVLSVDEEEEIAAGAKEEDLVAEEAEERAQTMTFEEDTAMAENDSNNIIHNGGIKTAGAEMNKDKNEKKGAEAKEEGHVEEEDGINIQKMDVEEDKAETEEASTTASHKSSRKPFRLLLSQRWKENEQSIKRLRDVVQQCHRYHQIKGKRGGKWQ